MRRSSGSKRAGDTGKRGQCPRRARASSRRRGVLRIASVRRFGPSCQTRFHAFFRSHSLDITKDTELEVTTDGERLIIEPVRSKDQRAEHRRKVAAASKRVSAKHRQLFARLAK